jgi:hypothetical protein
MANEPPKPNIDPDAAPDDIGPDPDTVRAAKHARDSTEKSPERRIMDDPDMGEDEHPSEEQAR